MARSTDPCSKGSLWLEGAETAPAHEPLRSAVHADVVIVGAGITGLTTAFLLQRAGAEVVVVEAGRVGCGASGGSSAHLSTLWDDGYHALIERHGEEMARRVARSLRGAIERIEEIADEAEIECDLERVAGYHYAEAGQDEEGVARELRAAQQIGLDVSPIRTLPLPIEIARGFRIAGQAQLHPVRYLQGLARAVERRGGRVFEHSRAVQIASGSPCEVHTESGGSVSAADLVLATHLPPGISPLQLAAAAYRSYALAFTADREPASGLFWDAADPYHYTRLHRDGERSLWIVGGADTKTGHGGELAALERLEAYVRERYPVARVSHRWSAQFYAPADHLPFIGPAPFADRTFLATGFSGDGLTFGTHAAELISAEISRKGHPDAPFYRCTRIPMANPCRLLSENADTALRFVADRLQIADKGRIESLAVGEGCVARSGLSPVAAYRGADGALHRFSAVCPHLKCVVRWNAEQRSFDCPCHGSRFGTRGEVLEGPALEGLTPL